MAAFIGSNNSAQSMIKEYEAYTAMPSPAPLTASLPPPALLPPPAPPAPAAAVAAAAAAAIASASATTSSASAAATAAAAARTSAAVATTSAATTAIASAASATTSAATAAAATAAAAATTSAAAAAAAAAATKLAAAAAEELTPMEFVSVLSAPKTITLSFTLDKIPSKLSPTQQTVCLVILLGAPGVTPSTAPWSFGLNCQITDEAFLYPEEEPISNVNQRALLWNVGQPNDKANNAVIKGCNLNDPHIKTRSITLRPSERERNPYALVWNKKDTFRMVKGHSYHCNLTFEEGSTVAQQVGYNSWEHQLFFVVTDKTTKQMSHIPCTFYANWARGVEPPPTDTEMSQLKEVPKKNYAAINLMTLPTAPIPQCPLLTKPQTMRITFTATWANTVSMRIFLGDGGPSTGAAWKFEFYLHSTQPTRRPLLSASEELIPLQDRALLWDEDNKLNPRFIKSMSSVKFTGEHIKTRSIALRTLSKKKCDEIVWVRKKGCQERSYLRVVQGKDYCIDVTFSPGSIIAQLVGYKKWRPLINLHVTAIPIIFSTSLDFKVNWASTDYDRTPLEKEEAEKAAALNQAESAANKAKQEAHLAAQQLAALQAAQKAAEEAPKLALEQAKKQAAMIAAQLAAQQKESQAHLGTKIATFQQAMTPIGH